MGRPPNCRRVSAMPGSTLFKPAGIPASMLEECVMTLDEFEALRLAHVEGMYQEDAAREMGVSRPTFGRILDSALRKVADAIVRGKSLRIEGGPVQSRGRRRWRCGRCNHELELIGVEDNPRSCPKCSQ